MTSSGADLDLAGTVLGPEPLKHIGQQVLGQDATPVLVQRLEGHVQRDPPVVLPARAR